MAQDKAERPCPTFLEATDVEKLDSRTYRVKLDEAFCIGAGTTSPHLRSSGYSTSAMSFYK